MAARISVQVPERENVDASLLPVPFTAASFDLVQSLPNLKTAKGLTQYTRIMIFLPVVAISVRCARHCMLYDCVFVAPFLSYIVFLVAQFEFRRIQAVTQHSARKRRSDKNTIKNQCEYLRQTCHKPFTLGTLPVLCNFWLFFKIYKMY